LKIADRVLVDLSRLPATAAALEDVRRSIEERLLHWWIIVGCTPYAAANSAGVVVDAFRLDGQDPDAIVGQPIGAIMGRYAVGEPPAGSRGISLRLMARAIAKVLIWRLTGRTWPHPFFHRETGRAKFPVVTLLAAERERLRPLCGPRPWCKTESVG
jgi:hypothetical protein